mgnify:FL=1
MPIKGLTEQEETIVKEILKPYFSKYDFYFYGSRVKGNFRPLSDLDILMKSNSEINLNDIDEIKENFDESDLPFVVNLAYDVDEKFYNLIVCDLIKVG